MLGLEVVACASSAAKLLVQRAGATVGSVGLASRAPRDAGVCGQIGVMLDQLRTVVEVALRAMRWEAFCWLVSQLGRRTS